MFGYLKNKLKDAVNKFSKEVDEDSEVVQEPETKPEEEPVPKEETPTKEKEPEETTKEPATEKETPEEQESLEEEPLHKEVQQTEVETGSTETAVVEPEKKEETTATTEETPEQESLEKEPLHEVPAEESEVEAETAVEEEPEEETHQQQAEPEKPSDESEETEKKGFFGKFRSSVVDAVTKSAISEDKFNELFWDIEMVLLENNVAVEVIEKIKQDLRDKLVNTKVRRGKTSDIIINTLNESIHDLFKMDKIDLEEKAKEKKPYIISFVGINGSGKTTTIAKLAHILKEKGYSSVISASDTFRAAAIQQLEEHADNVGVKLIKHDYGADPAAVAYDAIKYAHSKKVDFVFIDTAGRLHSNSNLIDEMKKIMRVAKPDLKLFVGESTTGNDCVEQAQRFNEAIGIDGIILAKADVDPKGGAAISVSYVTQRPILYIGTGQDYNDLREFDPQMVVQSLGLSG